MSISTTKRAEREHLSNVYATVTSLKMFQLIKVLADGILFVIFLTITIIKSNNPPSTVIRVINEDLFSIRLVYSNCSQPGGPDCSFYSSFRCW